MNQNEETPAIGIDFGGTSVKAGVVAGDRVLADASPIETRAHPGPEAIIDAVAATIDDLRARVPGIAAIGVGMPGLIDSARGIVHNLTNVPGWSGVPLRENLAARCGLPVAIDNDANCMAYAEWKRGAGRGCRHLVCVTLGTGVGGGIVVDGRLVRGARFSAGEIGQMSIDHQGRTGHYGNIGALEDYVGNREIAARAREAYAAKGVEKPSESCTPAALATAARSGDPVAAAIWEETARMLATALMSCCWLLNPEAIVIGGGVSRAGDLLFKPLEAHLLPQLSPPLRDHLRILPAAFSNEAGVIGAAAMALDAPET